MESWKGCLPHCMLSSTAVSSCCLVGFYLVFRKMSASLPYFKNLMTQLIFFWSVVYFPLPLGIFLCLGVHSFVNRNSKCELKLRHNMERRKYLMIHSRYFVYGYIASDMVNHHLDERKNQLPPLGLLFVSSTKGFFICLIQHRIAHTTAFVTPDVTWNFFLIFFIIIISTTTTKITY